MKMFGYKRSDGSVGIRNHVLILPSVGCANHIVEIIASKVQGVIPLYHIQGCGQLGKDREQTSRTLIGLGTNPNVAACLVVGLGCEQVSPEKLAEDISQSNKPVDSVTSINLGGELISIKKGIEIAQDYVSQSLKMEKEVIQVSDLVVGIKCALTDTTSGIAANPAVGKAADMIIKNGGTVIFGETSEFLGAEHILARRAINEKIAKRIYEITAEMEERARYMGVDIVGANPSPGNIERGITTIEEKSLGAILKGGSMPINGVLEYGEKVTEKGLYIMNSPGRTPEALTGLVASGANTLIMPTGGGSPGGSPIAPILKVTGNENTYKILNDYIDIDVSSIIKGKNTIDEAGKKIYKEIINVASGKKTKVEMLGYACMNIASQGLHV